MLGLREKGMLARTPSFPEAQRSLSRDSTACMLANHPQIRQPDKRDVRVASFRLRRLSRCRSLRSTLWNLVGDGEMDARCREEIWRQRDLVSRPCLGSAPRRVGVRAERL